MEALKYIYKTDRLVNELFNSKIDWKDKKWTQIN